MLLLIVSCSATTANPKTYFVSPEYNHYVYSSDDFEAKQEVYYLYEGDSKLQRVLFMDNSVNNSGVTEIFEFDSQSVTLTNIFNSIDYEDSLGATEEYGVTVLKGPLKKGTSWVDESAGQEYKITGMGVKVATKMGEFDCLELSITTPSTGDYETMYFAENIGLVKHVFTSTIQNEVDKVVVSEEEIETSFELEIAETLDLETIKGDIDSLIESQLEQEQ
jgi:hypothetical protein